MSEELLARLRTLREQGRVAVQRGDTADVQSVIQQALACANAEGAPQSAAIAEQLLGIASDVFAVGAPGDLEALFNLALQRIDKHRMHGSALC